MGSFGQRSAKLRTRAPPSLIMSDDEVDLELLDLMRKHWGGGAKEDGPPETKVLENAHFIYDNSMDVALDMRSTKLAAQLVLAEMEQREYSTKTWSDHELHPKAKDESTVNFIFTMDLLNFSFWSDKSDEERFAVVYKGKRWTGYWSLVAILQRALEQDIPITSPQFWLDETQCSEEVLRAVFSSGTDEEIPMFDQRVRCLREASQILEEEFDSSVVTLIEDAGHSAAALVNLLADKFNCFRDEGKFDNKKVRFLKRAQIFVADLWAAFDGQGYGEFNDIDKITMFADYRIPQMLHSLGMIWYCPPLENKIRRLESIESGHSWEMQIRGCSIWAVELLRREILKLKPDAKVNAILIDFFLERERKRRGRGDTTSSDKEHMVLTAWYGWSCNLQCNRGSLLNRVTFLTVPCIKIAAHGTGTIRHLIEGIEPFVENVGETEGRYFYPVPICAMGQTTSQTSLEHCLQIAVNDPGNVAFHDKFAFQLRDVRPYNLDYPVKPTAVTYPESAQQIAEIVKCARTYNLKVQPRSGGHSYANYGIGGEDGAIVVDMGKFQQFSIDNSTWQATIGAGTLLGDVTKRLHDNGNRAMTHGTSPQIGIGGHATIGGLGPTARMWGTSLDHVEEVEVVLADSSVVRASEKENQGLFFAIRGAGASFGIVTEFKVRTEPEPGSSVLYSYTFRGGSTASRADAFKQWQKLITDPGLSRKFASTFVLTDALAIVTGTFFGTQAEFESLNIASRLPAGPIPNLTEVKSWLGVVGHWGESLALQAGGGIPAHFYSKSLAFTENLAMSDETVDKLFNYIENANKGSALWFIIWDLEGGAINDVATTATSYPHRDVVFFLQSYAINLLGKVKDETRNFLTGVNKVITDAKPGQEFGAYAGYVDPALGNDSAEAYWGDNIDYLQRLKSSLDAEDVFHNPQSVRPLSKSVPRMSLL
ncbi:glucooligosaccharide oxidase [Pyrenophora seminiperda CCB06]|uniref:Queuosine 5'-phosphate N-glycosylase/hydrolase n=1 Tax=Pyrenophora seminiperda CCB06 TaxID=1302712 RepID=A0A3M7M3B6_9PLEO|nr:glucooligosaccharide oxidase [Pyrenophora seminiperda CCB06]